MKSGIFYYLFLFVFLLFSACNPSARSSEDAHGHGGAHSHEGHNHDHGDGGHSHDAEEEGEEDDHGDEIVFTHEQAEAVGLATESVEIGKFSHVIKAGGQIQAAQGDEATVVSTADGILSFGNSSLSEGAPIGKGETIAIISAQNLPEGDPAFKAKINYETASKELRRAEELAKDNIISAKEYEQVRLRYETARTVYESQAANMTANGIKVVSPIGGYIKSRIANRGEYVSVGQAIAVVSQNRRLQLRAEVSEANFKSLKTMKSANFKTAYDDRVYKLDDLNGRLLSFGKASGAQSFYIPVTFEFDNTGDLIPGAFAEVYLLSLAREAISVPLSALTEEQGLYFVYLQMDEEGYKKQEVAIGQDDGERVEIVSGLNSGDKVVVRGAMQIKLASLSNAVPEHSHSH